jgi:hypothetical protein
VAADVLALFSKDELIQENVLSVLWRLTDFGFRYIHDMKKHHVEVRVKEALKQYTHNTCIKERGAGILNWFSDRSSSRTTQRPSLNVLQLQLSLL